ncbi:hypothetical protein OH492_19425 [Vibrio chagasii]|nr:hypothetical protein [Vibrio chagasii]
MLALKALKSSDMTALLKSEIESLTGTSCDIKNRKPKRRRSSCQKQQKRSQSLDEQINQEYAHIKSWKS